MTTALYRRYRPETFADVIGQEHVTEPLMQALRTGRVNHAYLFSGPRGCGKTTSARILARCLNCEQGPTDTPCGTCESCVALARGGPGSIDVIEIDAASHGGVDDARDLREKASYGPARSRYKIYIIDEAHMVTPQGFNALLKIVEEPPEHVKFVFATTEPEKVIGTIRSRTHHYPFRLVPPARLHDYLQQLCDAEGVSVAPGVLSFVVRAGGGSVRDSLSVLDQLMAGAGDDGLTYERAAALLGFTDVELLDATVEALAAGDGASLFQQVDRVIESGQDPRRFVEDLLERLRDLIIILAVDDGAAAVLRAVPEDQLERMRQQAASFGAAALSRAADVVNAGLTEMTGATSPRLQLELICARVLLPGAVGERGYAARLDRLERRVELGVVAPGAQGHSQDQVPAPADAPGPTHGQGRDGQGQGGRDQGGHGQGGEGQGIGQSQGGQAPGQRQAPGAERSQGQEPRQAQEPSQAQGAGAGQAPAGARSGAAGGGAGAGGAAAGAGGGRQVDTAMLRRVWPDVLAKVFSMRRATWTMLSEHAQVIDYDGQRVLLGISTPGIANAFRTNRNHAELVRQALIEVIMVDARVEAAPMSELGNQHAQGGGSPAAGGPGVPAEGRASGGAPTGGAPTGGNASGRGAGPGVPATRTPAPAGIPGEGVDIGGGRGWSTGGQSAPDWAGAGGPGASTGPAASRAPAAPGAPGAHADPDPEEDEPEGAWLPPDEAGAPGAGGDSGDSADAQAGDSANDDGEFANDNRESADGAEHSVDHADGSDDDSDDDSNADDSDEAPAPGGPGAPTGVGIPPGSPAQSAPTESASPQQRRAWDRVQAQARTARERLTTPVVDDTAVSDDDESIADVDAGPRVITSVLGGTILQDEQTDS